jgi:hypothetical protein
MAKDSTPKATAPVSWKFNETIDFIIGMPPVNPRDTEGSQAGEPSRNDLQINSMPIVHIQPGIPNITKGIDLMSRSPAFSSISDEFTQTGSQRTGKRNSYVQMLRNLGFSLKQGHPGVSGHLTCAYLADNFPTDTFTNEYGENFLQKITNVASEGMAGVSQMFGGRSMTDVINSILSQVGAGGGVVGTGADAIKSGMDKLSKGIKNAAPEGTTMGRILNSANLLAAGGRIDFPMLWKNSTYSPSYTMTIRLYNPNPASREITAKYIIGPVAALLLLGLPQSVGEGVYSWPFIHRIWSPGIYHIDPAYISNITIVKGGDQQQIAWKQRMGVVDVRIDFGSVFNSILSNASESRNRPTLKGYLSAMAGEKYGVKGMTDFNRADNREDQSPAAIQNTKNLDPASNPVNTELHKRAAQLAGQRADLAPVQERTGMDIPEPDETIPARIGQDIKQIADDLIDLIPGGVRVIF